jgi:hypothetical protein
MDPEDNDAMNVINEIETIVASESARHSDEPLRWRIRSAISKVLGVNASEFSALLWFEYDISLYTRAEADAEAEILAWLRRLEIAAAPEVAAMIPFAHDECVFVRRYWACPGERLEPASATGEPFQEEARARFRKDMEKLVEHSKVHPYARGFAHMLVSETSGTILLTSWSMLQPGTPREQKDFLASIDAQLARPW